MARLLAAVVEQLHCAAAAHDQLPAAVVFQGSVAQMKSSVDLRAASLVP